MHEASEPKEPAHYFETLLEQAGVGENNALVVGVSGGPDSIALLHQLRRYAPAVHLHVAHFDHRLRDEAAAEASFVAALAEEWGLNFHQDAADVRALAAETSQSIEEAAREARYAFLATVARRVGADHVAVGHHAGDQAETVLLNLLRGSGLSGLGGMRPISSLPGAPDILLLRPLLKQTREEIEAYCAAHGLAAMQDESNFDTQYLRNRVRHELLPQLATYNPQAARHLVQLAELAAEEEGFLEQLVSQLWPELVKGAGEGWLSIDRKRWRVLPLVMKRRVLRRAAVAVSPELRNLSFKTAAQAIDLADRSQAGLETALSSNVRLLIEHDVLTYVAGTAEPPVTVPQLFPEEPLILSVPGTLELGNGWRLSALLLDENSVPLVNHTRWQEVVDLGRIDRLKVRARYPGERMQPLGMAGKSASVQDLMVNRKIAARLRSRWPIVSTGESAVWLVGHVLDHRFRITAASKRLVRLTCERVEVISG